MLYALIGMAVILASPWIFLHFSPATPQRRWLAAFNVLVLAVTGLACVFLSLWVRDQMLPTADAEWWPVVALAYSALLFPILLLIGGLIRNFLWFRK